MCGIAGIWDFNSIVETGRIEKMTNIISHRGPDGEGSWSKEDGKLVLGHRRLSIIDLSAKGTQPMHCLNRYTITFNGEIYNYIELREELKKKGYTFNTDTDTEIIPAAYNEYGAECLAHFDGMFAFALWDSKEEVLFCARDRFGEKPFFYTHQQGKVFRFASEMKGLWADGVLKELNMKMLYYFLAYDVIENPFDKSETFYKSIFRLEAAHYLVVKKDGSIKKQRYWDIDLTRKSDLSFKEATTRFSELFFQSVERRLRADVPVGSSLSGGLDSSTVVCAIGQLRSEGKHAQNSFSARFYDEKLDEGKYIDEVAKVTNIQRHDVWVNEQIIFDNLQKVMYHQEEPMGGPSPFAQWCVMKLAKEKNVTVLLDGQGADEILGGYLHFFRPYFNELYLTDKKKFKAETLAYKTLHQKPFHPNLNFKLHARFPSLFRNAGKLKRRVTVPDYLSFLHPDFFHLYKNETPPFETFNSLNESLKYFTGVYGLEKLLRFADRNSMAHSREVRLPFLNHELVEFLFSLPPDYKIHEGWTKYILRVSMQNILPHSIAWRVNKLGFNTPITNLLKVPLAEEQIQATSAKLNSLKIIKANADFKERNWKLLELSNFFG